MLHGGVVPTRGAGVAATSDGARPGKLRNNTTVQQAVIQIIKARSSARPGHANV
jgi:hypothetical protein